ncbi:hypothetical protein BDK92_7285 [Micromonospora pisi]|uniref:Uncharacterized protein n=1 Tax=Micromonospora pisi TaxID=589240 RepID=A0A495JUY4_9ACTN|nr:hypothetical protein [Micromonospora pisi]RKR92803.1 hypothetical protein BDK92_7285 [Micromonospora pisi]
MHSQSGHPLGDPTGIPVHIDSAVPAGAAVLDISDDDHITGIRVGSGGFDFTDEQVAQIRAHYAAMDRRAARLLHWWSLQQFGAAALNPRSTIHVAGDLT